MNDCRIISVNNMHCINVYYFVYCNEMRRCLMTNYERIKNNIKTISLKEMLPGITDQQIRMSRRKYQLYKALKKEFGKRG